MDENLLHLEQQLARTSPGGAPPELRAAVLGDLRRELASSRWDRRLARTAMLLVATGVAMNAAMVLDLGSSAHGVRPRPSQSSLVQTAVAVARATDAETGRQVAQQLAAWSGRKMSPEQLATLNAALAAELRHEKEG
jgi:hypothetical protein